MYAAVNPEQAFHLSGTSQFIPNENLVFCSHLVDEVYKFFSLLPPTHCYWTHTTSPPQWLPWKRRDSLQDLYSPGQSESPQFLQWDPSFSLLLLPPAAARPWPPSHTPSCKGLSGPKGWPSSPPSCGTGTRAIRAVSRTWHFLLACGSSPLLLLTLDSLSLWNGTWIQLPDTHTEWRHWCGYWRWGEFKF